MLCYYDSQEDWEKAKEPLKGVALTIRNYKIDP